MVNGYKKLKDTTYTYRSWPLLTTYERIIQQFGIDIMMYHIFLLFMAIIVIIGFVVYLPIQFIFWCNDYFKPTSIFKINLSSIFTIISFEEVRGLIWLGFLVVFLVSVSFIQLVRKSSEQYLDDKQNEPVNQRTLIVQNLQSTSSDIQVKQVLFDLTNIKPTKFLRVSKCRQLHLQRKLFIEEKEFYDRIVEDPKGLVEQEQTNLLKFCRVFHLIILAQSFGAFRDEQYYRKTMIKLEGKIHSYNEKNLSKLTDVILLTYETSGDLKTVFKQAKKKWSIKVDGKSIKLLRSYHPDDIIYENLDSSQFERVWKRIFAYLLVFMTSLLLFFTMVPLRNVTRNLKNLTSNWFLQQIYYWSSFLVLFLWDQGLRPILRWVVKFERHHSFSNQESSFLNKYYFYILLNRLSVIFSRQVQIIFDWIGQEHLNFSVVFNQFMRIYGFDKHYRHGSDSIGVDIANIFWIEVVIYNLFDLLVSLFFKFILWLQANTEYGRAEYYKGKPIRYASLFTNMNVLIALILGFGFAQVYTIPIFLVYMLVHSFVTRYRLLRITSPPPRQSKLFKTTEFHLCINASLGVFGLSLSYFDKITTVGWLIITALSLLSFIFIIGFQDPVYKWLYNKLSSRVKHQEDNSFLVSSQNSFQEVEDVFDFINKQKLEHRFSQFKLQDTLIEQQSSTKTVSNPHFQEQGITLIE